VHRDIKPDNVFLSSDTGSGDGLNVQPKLVDFGIAKLAQRDVSSQLTQKGAVLGSPDYMSPEQARGDDDIDHRADIWSFCVLFYEVVSGQPPFEGNNYNALMRAIVETRAPSLQEMCATDAELSAIIATGMAKSRSDRWQSMQALGEALAIWLLRQGIFEDAAGGSVEAKWILRRSDPAVRQSRSSLTTSPGFGRTEPSSVTERRLAAEAPTSVGPVVTGTGNGTRRRLLIPAAVALGLLLLGFVLWPAKRLDPEATSVVPKASVTVAPGAALPTASAAPNPSPQLPAEPPATARANPVESKQAKPRSRPAAAAPSPLGRQKPGAERDLMSPY
jgi:serine/threonine-protein kinase